LFQTVKERQEIEALSQEQVEHPQSLLVIQMTVKRQELDFPVAAEEPFQAHAEQ
jgi:hypothetical protein